MQQLDAGHLLARLGHLDAVSDQDAPAIDAYLKTHLFGDIFERDNLDWQSRELATVGMLSALPGAEAQLQSHMRISMNVGLTVGQLDQLVQVLALDDDRHDARPLRPDVGDAQPVAAACRSGVSTR